MKSLLSVYVAVMSGFVSAVTCCAFPTDLTGHPESIAEEDDVYYASVLGQKMEPTMKDGDGSICKLNRRGKVLLENAFPGVVLHAPKGLCEEDGVLYVADVDRIVGIHMKTGRQTMEIDFSKTSTKYLNDIVEENEMLYVSATDINAIFAVNKRSGDYTKLQTAVPLNEPNGLDVDDGVLYVAEYGTSADGKAAGRIVSMPCASMQPRPVTVVYEGPGRFDGLQVEDEDRWFGRPDDIVVYFSDWGPDGKTGAVRKLNLRTRDVTTLTDKPVFGPADFIIEDDSVILPVMGERRIYRL